MMLKFDLATNKLCSIIEADKLEFHVAIKYQEMILNDLKQKAAQQANATK